MSESLIVTAKKAVPSFRWVIAAAGLLALAGTVIQWGFNLATLFLVSGVMIAIAVSFIVLQWIARLGARHSTPMAGFFAWSMLLFVVLALAFVLSSATFNWPWPLQRAIERLINGDDPRPDPSTDLAQRVIAVIREEARVKPSEITLQSSLELDLGFDKLFRVELFQALEEHFKISITDEEMLRAITVADVIDLVRSKSPPQSPQADP